MESNIPYFSLPFLDSETSELGFSKPEPQECEYDELHPILPSHGSLLGPDDVLAQFLYGDEPLEEPDLNGPTTLHCEICRKQFDNAKKYHGHLRVHCKENKWVCDKCPNEKFSTKQLLMKHSLTHKPLQRVWRCPQCTMSFEALWRLQQHLFAKHLDYRPHKCHKCEKSFHKQSDLYKHENVHRGVKNHSCTVCTKVFADKSNLRRHMLTHTKEKPFCCPNCGNRFQQIASLNRHRKNCAARNNQPESSEVVDKTTRKNYCRVCGMVFQYKSALLEHCVRAHTNNTPEDKEKEDKSNHMNNDPQGTEEYIVDDILSAEDDYMTMNTHSDILNAYNNQYDAANVDNLMQYELLKDMNQLHMLDDELLLNDIDFDSLQTNHIFTNDIDCPADKTSEILFDLADCGRSLDQDLMNSLYQVKAEHLPDELLNAPAVLSVEDKTNEYFENPTISVNECATIFESDVDLDASTNLAANLNQLIGENKVQYICTEHDDTFIISINKEIDAEKLTDILNIGVGLVDEVTKSGQTRAVEAENLCSINNAELVQTTKDVVDVVAITEATKQTDQKDEKKVKVKKRKLYVCPNCDKLFAKKCNYESHIATHEPSLRRHTCRVCTAKFSYKSTLNKHMRSHHTPGVYPNHACGLCDKSYKAAWLLKSHMERDHEGIAQYKCQQKDCDKKFYKKSDLDKHERSHTGVRPYVCEACARRFGQSSHLKRHERSCKERKKLAKKKKRPVPDLHPRVNKLPVIY
ncbi:hypothetical protein K1T71_011358 [Dendrolimus kikuchii]|uniref:Uncharacterized protein n=1 Tax=Dendrolimus kikuchii TaxID=765133 RepID=A0ACC1CNY3_9NEOP|nr:hypothetical protein K1T71_011358 [Dendrolimus kikuchii]